MTRPQLVSSVFFYVVKVWLAGVAAAVFVPLSVAALVVDLLVRPAEPLSDRVLAASARLEAAVDVHGHRTDIRVVADGPAGDGLVAERA